MSYTTLACGDAHTKKFYLANEGASVPIVLGCQRQSGHSGEHAALWVSGFVTWWYEA